MDHTDKYTINLKILEENIKADPLDFRLGDEILDIIEKHDP